MLILESLVHSAISGMLIVVLVCNLIMTHKVQHLITCHLYIFFDEESVQDICATFFSKINSSNSDFIEL